MLDSIKIKLQYWLPKLALTRLAGWGADKRAGWLTQLVVKAFARFYRVDMQEAQNPDLASYATFNDFFVRPLLTARARSSPTPTGWRCLPMAPSASSARSATIKSSRPKATTTAWKRCWPATTCWPSHSATACSPPPIWRRATACMPCAGVLREMIYVPGDLFSVNPLTAANVPNLFARNERA